MASPSPAPDHAWLCTLFSTGYASDCIIKAKEGEKLFNLHRVIVTSRSKVFEKMLDPAGPFKESVSAAAPVEVGDVSEEVLGTSLGFLYGIPLPALAPDLALDVAEFGYRMEIESLEAAAAGIVADHLESEGTAVLEGGLLLSDCSVNFLASLEAGGRMGNSQIRTSAIGYMSKTLGFLVDKKDGWIKALSVEDMCSLVQAFLVDAAHKQGRHVVGYSANMGKVAVAFDGIFQWAGLSIEAGSDATAASGGPSVAPSTCPRVADGSLEKVFESVDVTAASLEDWNFVQNALDFTGTSSHCLLQKAVRQVIQLTKKATTGIGNTCPRCRRTLNQAYGHLRYCNNCGHV